MIFVWECKTSCYQTSIRYQCLLLSSVGHLACVCNEVISSCETSAEYLNPLRCDTLATSVKALPLQNTQLSAQMEKLRSVTL